MDTNLIKKHLYEDDEAKAIAYINSLQDNESLFVYANNYNWDNGFAIPNAIVKNPACELSTALLLFHLANGIAYLESKEPNPLLPTWSKFIAELYTKIKGNSFIQGEIAFHVELSKIQLYKIRKVVSEDELVFLTDIAGKDCYIQL